MSPVDLGQGALLLGTILLSLLLFAVFIALCVAIDALMSLLGWFVDYGWGHLCCWARLLRLWPRRVAIRAEMAVVLRAYRGTSCAPSWLSRALLRDLDRLSRRLEEIS